MAKANKDKIEQKLESRDFYKKLKLAQNFEKYSGGGLKRKLQRILYASKIYLPYLLVVKAGIGKKGTSKTKLFWGRKIEIPLTDFDSLALRTYGFAGGTEAELKLTKFFIKNLKQEDVFYDIGANYGFFTYLAEELCQEVHSFEPIPSLSEIIKNNSRNNTRVNNLAISNQKGVTKLFMSESTGLSTINESATKIHTYSYDQAKEIEVKTDSLDAYCEKFNKPTILKIDVEGAEGEVVDGATFFLQNHAPVIAMEIWGEGNGGDISKVAVARLRKLGFESYQIEPTGNIQKVEGDITRLIPAMGADNFIFKKN